MAVITPAAGDGSVEATTAAPTEFEAVFFNVTAGGITTAKIGDDQVTNAKAANMAEATIKGRAAGSGTGDPTDLTATQVTAIPNAFVGDSGAGGTKGMVPAPAAGDAAAGKLLHADGTWTAPTESAQDAVGGILVDTARIDLTYDDATPQITADIVADSVSNTYLANMAEATIKGRAAGAGTGDPTDLTATQVTAIPNAFVGDSGSGGTKGLVLAPAANDNLLHKFLHADGTWNYASVAAAGSDPAGDSLTAATISTTETAFATTITIPANTLVDNTMYRLWYLMDYTTSATAPTIRYKLRKDNASGTTIFDSAAQAPGNSMTNENGCMPFVILGTGAAGASVNTITMHVGRSNHNITIAAGAVAQPVALATNADLVICLTITYSANTAGNTVTLQGVYLERLQVAA